MPVFNTSPQYIKDAAWFRQSFSTASEAVADPEKAQARAQVKKLLRGPFEHVGMWRSPNRRVAALLERSVEEGCKALL